MISKPRRKDRIAFTLIELLIGVAVICVLLALLLPRPTTRPDKESWVRCLTNLRQVNLALILYAGDQRDLLPWQIPNSDTQLQANLEFSAADHFSQLTNYLRDPLIFVCPTDPLRHKAATDFANFSNSNLSYFASIDASLQPESPIHTNVVETILTGDRHLAYYNDAATPGLLVVTNHNGMRWTEELHRASNHEFTAGVLGFLDGHAQRVTSEKLPLTFAAQSQPVTRLMIP